jgi:hypothetical protein
MVSSATSRQPSGSNILYSEREVQLLAKGFGNLKQQGVKRVYVIFNNCYQNFRIIDASTMAAILRGQEQ